MATAAVAVMEIHRGSPTTASRATAGAYMTMPICIVYNKTISAVAKRPRDASCLPVVSFNSTKRRVESFIVSHVGYRFVTAGVKCAVLLSLA